MTQVPPGSLVLVTGVNGHVASATALRLLQKGYRVRGTVRKLASAEYVQKEFAPYGVMFAVAEVPDIVAPGAFDEALKCEYNAAGPLRCADSFCLGECRCGCCNSHCVARHNGLEETGGTGKSDSPLLGNPVQSNIAGHIQYIPSIDGTLNIMRSAAAAPAVKRFLYFGSMGSVVMGAKDPAKEIITRDDWNTMTPELVKNLDDPMIGFHIYIGSKIEAERAAWAFMEKEKVRPQSSMIRNI